MAEVREAVTTQLIVGDIVSAFRLELAYWIPVLLTPLVQELKDLKNQSAPEKDRVCDKVCTAPVSAPVSSDLQALLTPLVAELKDLKRQIPVWKDEDGEKICAVASEKYFSQVASVNLASESERSSSERDAKTTSVAAVANERPVTFKADTFSTEKARERDGQPPSVLNPSSVVSVVKSAETKSGDARVVRQQKKFEPEQHQQTKFEAFPPPSPSPMDKELELTSPLVDAAGQPEIFLVPGEREGLRGWSCRDLCFQKSSSSRAGYHLTPRSDPSEEEVSLEIEMVDTDGREFTDPETVNKVPKQIARLEKEEAAACESLEDLDALWKNRRSPYEEDIAKIRKEIESLQDKLELARVPRSDEPLPPGPASLNCVDSAAFGAFCNLVVLLNLICMVAGPKFKNYASLLQVLDQVFLAWYVVELTTKAVYYQCSLVCGKISVVWWNWLDLGIVVSGVVDQWLLPLFMAINGGDFNFDTSALRALRLLRLFRIMRFLRIIKAFLKSDFAWTEGATFEWCMAGVIAFNSIVMSIEIDVPWPGWWYIENGLQIVYTFELSVRLKRQCCRFFLDIKNMVWNYLDFIMVVGGALDLWLVPLIFLLQGVLFGNSPPNDHSPITGVLRILKIMRILRVLRLVRLLKMVKPLYRLLIGVIASVKAMQWVMVLTFLTLYACSIVFTDLVGKGLMSSGLVTTSAFQYFGSVPKSLFSLFKLMNGDMTVVAPITGSITGQLLFAGFMVVSNWAILAVLTAVVSDNMITTSAKANEEEEQRKIELDHQKRIRRLTALFREIDRDGEGTINTAEWQRMLADRSLQRALCDASGLELEDLNDYFECLAKDPKQEEKNRRTLSAKGLDLYLDYHSFIEALKDEGVADKRSILHVMKALRILESHVVRDFEKHANQGKE